MTSLLKAILIPPVKLKIKKKPEKLKNKTENSYTFIWGEIN